MKIAIFGGSFDPIHNGHLKVIKEALNSLDIDRLFVVPTFLNPFKNDFLIEPLIRLKVLSKSLQEYDKVEVCDFEIKQNSKTPSIKTVEFLSKKYKIDKIYLIIGADNLKNLHKWYNFYLLSKMVEFVVATRDGYEIGASFKRLDVNVDISSTYLRVNLKEEFLPKNIARDVIDYINRKEQMQTSQSQIDKIIKLIDSKKGYDIEIIEMNEEYFVDKVVIATTLGDKHTLALIQYIKEILKKRDILNIEESEEWSIIDLGDVLIHLMIPEYREKYKLEEFLKTMKKR